MSNTIKYLSKYSNGKTVSAAQYITELICENKAIQDKLDLHYKFWLDKKWANYYKNQIASSHKLLKKYHPTAIINAIKNPKAKKIYSLRAPHLVGIIEYEQEKLNSIQNSKPVSINRSTTQEFRKVESKKSILSKLKDIDNES